MDYCVLGLRFDMQGFPWISLWCSHCPSHCQNQLEPILEIKLINQSQFFINEET
jgi:hypothetical protein